MSYLSGRCHDGRRVVGEVVADLFGVPVSLGTVSAREAEMSGALAGAYAQAGRSVRSSANRNVDETGWRQAGRRRWLWVAAARAAAVFAVHARRGWDGLRSVLGPDPRAAAAGVVTSDRFPTYDGLDPARRQVCWSHLARDFRKWSEPGGPGPLARAMGRDGRAVARRVLASWRDFRRGRVGRGRVGRGTLQEALARLRKRLGRVLRAGARLAGAADAKAATFCRKLIALGPALWTFAERDGVEPTNNHAERCLRPAVLWRKNSFGAHSDRGCRFVERMLTVVTTLRLRHKGVLDYLCRALAAHRLGLPAPSLLG